MRITIAILALSFAAMPAPAQKKVDPARADTAIKAAFPTAPADWASRLTGDETMQQCSASHNNPAKDVAAAIQKREQGTIVYPPDNNFMGDWQKGERLAQSGYGLRFTDYPPRQANGGNCYACHQLTKNEVSYGTLGPSLSEYGKLRDFKPEAVKAAYEKLYNSHMAFPCSTMPRFGANKILTIEQIKDAVALLMSPESPVNTGK
ncbi:MAG: sulfur oxidation c-type cytochrome SoxX [Alphaproteobacteria bacterium]|nr:MAG: sulfur oxidation c-type cytochrome SoxX [Alphaproteobacteria bacterium]